MFVSHRSTAAQRITATLTILTLFAPVLILPVASARAAQTMSPAPKKGFSTKQKVVALAGAALLYYLYRKYQAKQQANAAAAPTANTGTASTAAAHPQLYRSKNGGIYYRDGQGKAIWVTSPVQRLEVPASEVQQYAPDYRQYRNQPAPPAPAGYRTQSFSALDDSLIRSGSGVVPGPRG